MSTPFKAPPPPPTYYTSVEVEIDPDDLIAAGWTYKSDDEEDEPMPAEIVVRVVADWHDDTHPGPWRWCERRPCADLRERPMN